MNHHHDNTDANATPNAPVRTIRRGASLLGAAVVLASTFLLAGTGCDGTTADPDPSTTPEGTIACGASELTSLVHDACGAMDAQGVPDSNGACLCTLGWAWDGAACVMLGNCACEGADCDKLSETPEQCEADHASCTLPTPLHCGDSALYALVHDECAPMDAAAAGDGDGHCNCMLGFAWDGTACVGLGDCVCEGADCDKLTQTIEECQSEHETCTAPSGSGIQCGDVTLYSLVHDECAAMDAVAADDENGAGCYCMLGYAWDGAECVALGNCRCLGDDCDKLTETIEECQADHTTCS